MSVTRDLEEKDPILCMKALYPEIYGPLNFSRYVDDDVFTEYLMALNQVVIGGYEGQGEVLDVSAAEAAIPQLVQRLYSFAVTADAMG